MRGHLLAFYKVAKYRDNNYFEKLKRKHTHTIRFALISFASKLKHGVT